MPPSLKCQLSFGEKRAPGWSLFLSRTGEVSDIDAHMEVSTFYIDRMPDIRTEAAVLRPRPAAKTRSVASVMISARR